MLVVEPPVDFHTAHFTTHDTQEDGSMASHMRNGSEIADLDKRSSMGLTQDFYTINTRKGKEIDSGPLLDGPESPVASEQAMEDKSDEDWTRYEPPSALTSLPNITSELIRDLIETSIQNVRNHIAQDADARRQIEDEKRKAVELQKSEAKVPEPSSPATTVQIQLPEIAQTQHLEVSPGRSGPLRWLRSVTGASDKGETSAAGARRLRARSTSNNELARQISASVHRHTGLLRKLNKKDKTGPSGPTVECVSCFEDVPVQSAVKAPCHSYCAECFERLVGTAIENESQWPPKCCLNEIPSKTITKNISKDLAKQYAAKTVEYGVPVEDRIYCSEPNVSD